MTSFLGRATAQSCCSQGVEDVSRGRKTGIASPEVQDFFYIIAHCNCLHINISISIRSILSLTIYMLIATGDLDISTDELDRGQTRSTLPSEAK